jgi:hypothetical protein
MISNSIKYNEEVENYELAGLLKYILDEINTK